MKPTKTDSKIISAYQKWQNLQQTAWALNTSARKVKEILKKYGIKLNTHRFNNFSPYGIK